MPLIPNFNLSVLIIWVLARVANSFSYSARDIIASVYPCYSRIQSQFEQNRRTQLHLSTDGGDGNGASAATSGGAGSWRAKAKDFQKSSGSFDGDSVDRKLNIAFVTGNAMKQKEINMILSHHGATSDHDGESFVNLRILDVDLPEIQGEMFFSYTLVLHDS